MEGADLQRFYFENFYHKVCHTYSAAGNESRVYCRWISMVLFLWGMSRKIICGFITRLLFLVLFVVLRIELRVLPHAEKHSLLNHNHSLPYFRTNTTTDIHHHPSPSMGRFSIKVNIYWVSLFSYFIWSENDLLLSLGRTSLCICIFIHIHI
jgi:hypothetical protein